MSKQENKYNENSQEYLEILRHIKKTEELSQRNLAKTLGFSLGKLNYLIRALQKKGLIKIENFKKNPNKSKYLYYLTPKGLTVKTTLTLNFMERKLAEEEDDFEDDDEERIKIHTDTMDLTGFDILDEPKESKVESANIFLEAEELP
mgnify:CR=1 FL=1